jgi:hypothetical protein
MPCREPGPPRSGSSRSIRKYITSSGCRISTSANGSQTAPMTSGSSHSTLTVLFSLRRLRIRRMGNGFSSIRFTIACRSTLAFET